MELTAAIEGLRALKTRCAVTLYTDSRYIADAVMKGWARKWRANGWMRNRKDRALNPDLWERLLDLCERHDVTFAWVQGHSGNSENERCDLLSVEASRRDDLPPDPGYDG